MQSYAANMDDEEFVVEEIVDKWTPRNGQVEFLVKWKGYGDEDNSWELASNLDCDELIREII